MENSYEHDFMWKTKRNPHSDKLYRDHYEKAFSGTEIKSIHDCTSTALTRKGS